MQIDNIVEKMEIVLKREEQTSLSEATPVQLHRALGHVVMDAIADRWFESRHAHERAVFRQVTAPMFNDDVGYFRVVQ